MVLERARRSRGRCGAGVASPTAVAGAAGDGLWTTPGRSTSLRPLLPNRRQTAADRRRMIKNNPDALALLGAPSSTLGMYSSRAAQRPLHAQRRAADERFVALCLWDAGQASKIHDHAGSSCFVKLLSGDLEEQKYAPRWLDGTWRKLGGPEAVATGQVTYMDDSRGLHRISNPSAEVPAVSLHIYAPGFEECGIYGDDGAVSVGSMVGDGRGVRQRVLDQGKLSLAALGDELAAAPRTSTRCWLGSS